MSYKSWEIVVTGLIFIGLSIYLINHQNTDTVTKSEPAAADSIKINFLDEGVRVISLNRLSKLQNLENLEHLKELENLGNLENLENLEKLKVLANYMPAEVKQDFITEIDKAMKELDHELVDVQVNIEKGLISVEKLKDLKTGTWSIISPGVFAYVKEFDASEIDNASLQIPFGSITVVGTDGNKAKLVIQASGKIGSKEELESKLNAYFHINNKKADFTISTPSAQTSKENLHLQATLNVPSSTGLTMHTKGGHIESTNIDGAQIYKTNGGHINLNQLSGKVDASTSGGHIAMAGSKGIFTLKTEGGHVSATNSEGEFVFTTGGGNIHSEKIGGKVEATTGGGNIELKFSSVNGNIFAKTGAGSIFLTLPSSVNANLNASGNSIEMDPALPFTGTNSSGSAKGKLGEGGVAIDAKTGYGKVVIKKNN